MNRSELVDAVETATGLDKHQAESAVKAVFETVVAEIKADNKVQVFGFGTFTPTSRAARVGRNPQTGEAVNIAASTGVRFAPATALKALLNPPKPAKKSGAKKAAAAAAVKPSKKTATAKKAAAEKPAKASKKSAKKK